MVKDTKQSDGKTKNIGSRHPVLVLGIVDVFLWKTNK